MSTEERRLKDLLSQIQRRLDEEADLVEPTPALVATPKPVAVSMEQAAALFDVTLRTLDEYVSSGQLRTFRMGRRRLVRLDALHEFALAQENAESLVEGATLGLGLEGRRGGPTKNGRQG